MLKQLQDDPRARLKKTKKQDDEEEKKKEKPKKNYKTPGRSKLPYPNTQGVQSTWLHLQKIISRTPLPRLLGGSAAVVHGQFMGTAHRTTASIGADGAGSSDDSSDERLCQRLHDTITTALGRNAADQNLINSLPFQFPTVLDAVVYLTTKRPTRW